MKITRREFIITSFLAGIGLILSDSLFFERFFIETNEFDIGDFEKNNPKIKIIQLSDLHLRNISWYHENLAKKVNSLNPDLIFFTGDSVDKAQNLELLDELLGLFNADLQKIAILGNWEYQGEIDLVRLKEIYKKHNCDLLINESISYDFKDKRVMITGVDDLVDGNADFLSAIKNVIREENHLVLSHCPLYRDDIENETEKINLEKPEDEKLKIDYVFSGHAHGGQINIFGFIPFLPKGIGRYVKGWYIERKPDLYVSKGIGTSILPIRFRARAEMTIFNYSLKG